MSNILSAVNTQVTNAFHTVATSAVAIAKQTCSFGGRIVGYVTPTISALAAKVQSIRVPAFLATAWTAARSDVSASTFFLIAGVAALAVARTTGKSALYKAALYTAGAASIALAAVVASGQYSFAAKA